MKIKTVNQILICVFIYSILVLAKLRYEVGITERLHQMLLIALFLVCFILIIYKNRFKVFVISKFNFFLIITYCCLLILSTISHGYFYRLRTVIFMVLIINLFLLFLPSLQSSEENIILILKCFIIMGGIISSLYLLNNGYMIFDKLLHNITIYDSEIVTFLKNKNSDAFMVFISLCFTYILYQIKSSFSLFFLIILQGITILFLFSRSIYLALFLFWFSFNIMYNSYKKIFILIFIFIVSAFVILNSNVIIENFLRLERGLSGRSELWNHAIKLIEDNIIFGPGINTWRDYFKNLSPHNTYLAIAVYWGGLSLVNYLLLIINIMTNSINRIKMSFGNLRILHIGFTSMFIGIGSMTFFKTVIIGQENYRAVYILLIWGLLLLSNKLVLYNCETN